MYTDISTGTAANVSADISTGTAANVSADISTGISTGSPLGASASLYSLSHVSDDELHSNTRRLVGRSNQLLAALLGHLAEVEARGIHRERACASLTTYCVYELRFSEDAAFRRARAARLAREFPVVLEHIAAGELHLTALLLLGPHLTEQNHRELLALAKHRTKREVLRLVRRLDPARDVPATVEPLGPAPLGVPLPRAASWQEFIEASTPTVRELPPGDSPKDWTTGDATGDDSDLGAAPRDGAPTSQRRSCDLDTALRDGDPGAAPAPQHRSCRANAESSGLRAERYRVEFSADQEYIDLLQQARDLASHALPSGSIAELHLQAMRLLVTELKRRRCAGVTRPTTTTPPSAPRQSRTDACNPHQLSEQSSAPL